jgi:NADP-dependent 3-hydroxy acid dehydrogenase YdfG
VENYQRIDLLVNNAGITMAGREPSTGERSHAG